MTFMLGERGDDRIDQLAVGRGGIDAFRQTDEIQDDQVSASSDACASWRDFLLSKYT